MLDTSDEWIVERTGIRERRVAGPARPPGRWRSRPPARALARAGLDAGRRRRRRRRHRHARAPDPLHRGLVAAELGIAAGAFDLNAACAGFVYALTITAGLLAAGVGRARCCWSGPTR